eukprot:1100359_1
MSLLFISIEYDRTHHMASFTPSKTQNRTCSRNQLKVIAFGNLEAKHHPSETPCIDLIAITTTTTTTMPTVEPTETQCVEGKSSTEDLMIVMKINCDELYGWIHLDIVYFAYDENWFGLVFN